MAKGLRFFGTDYNANEFDGSTTASSSIANAMFAFDGLQGTRWISSGENTDGNAVYLEVDYNQSRTVDCFFIYQTNIEDLEVQTWNGSTWVTASPSISTIIQSTDLLNYFIQLDTPVLTTKVKIVGSNTITPNQEKYVTLFHAFVEIGQFEFFPDFKPKVSSKQNTFQTTDGRSFIIERGEFFSAVIEFKSHINQNDIDLAQTLFDRKEPFFIWPNGGDESIFRFSFKPFRFQDIFKVSIVGDNNPTYTKNYYKAGFNSNMNLIEVV